MEDFGADRVNILDGNATGKQFGGTVAQEEIFGGYIPAPDNSDAYEMIKQQKDGSAGTPAFIPTVPEK